MRLCDNPEPKYNGKECLNASEEVQICAHGGWSKWSNFSECSSTCGSHSAKYRQRNCDNPEPFNGGQNCTGPDVEIKNCSNYQEITCPSKNAYLFNFNP